MNCAYRDTLEGLKRLAFFSFPMLALLLACQKKSPSSPPTEAEQNAIAEAVRQGHICREESANRRVARTSPTSYGSCRSNGSPGLSVAP